MIAISARNSISREPAALKTRSSLGNATLRVSRECSAKIQVPVLSVCRVKFQTK
jgi:hypothetical protein